jgi:hypothetical protein
MVVCTILKPYYDWDSRKYIDVILDLKIIKLKIPFRYGRVMCKVSGLKTVQEMKKDEIIDVEFMKKSWNGIEHLILVSIKEC